MRTLAGAAALAAALGALPALAVPYHGCTFFQPQLVTASMACAAFTVVYPGCTIVHCSPVGCVTYPGARFSGWMPDHFIEVTNRPGLSAFTTADAPLLVAQMVAARSTWTARGDVGGVSMTEDLPRAGDDFSMYFGRSLQVPYGSVGWSLATVGITGGTPAIPTCYSAISEFAPETWADTLASGDRLLAAKWSPVTSVACNTGLVDGSLAAAAAPSANVCAYPIPAAAQTALAVSGAAALDPTRQCMGDLGGLLPRTGFTESGTYTAAERVAWRTASLAEDYFKTGVGVIALDKWQIVHPTALLPTCFRPGSLLRPSPALGTEEFVRPPTYDATGLGTTGAEYVFAVWRFRTKCLEPVDYPAAVAEVAAYTTVHTAACSVLNAASSP